MPRRGQAGFFIHSPCIVVVVQAADRDLYGHDCGMNTLQTFRCTDISWQKSKPCLGLVIMFHECSLLVLLFSLPEVCFLRYNMHYAQYYSSEKEFVRFLQLFTGRKKQHRKTFLSNTEKGSTVKQ